MGDLHQESLNDGGGGSVLDSENSPGEGELVFSSPPATLLYYPLIRHYGTIPCQGVIPDSEPDATYTGNAISRTPAVRSVELDRQLAHFDPPRLSLHDSV